MNLKLTILLLVLLLVSCSSPPEETDLPSLPDEPIPLPETSEDKVPTSDTELREGPNADVVHVRAEWKENHTWTFYVTVAHPDTGWEDYADGWDVVLPDGTVVKPDPSSPFTRLLLHPHEDEQPFTRSQSRIEIPEDVTEVTVRAHDLVDGFGGYQVVVKLDQAYGKDFEVDRPGMDPVTLTMGLTHQQPDGNRYVPGQIDLAATEPITIPLLGEPVWVVGIPSGEAGVMWLVVFADGKMQAITIDNGEIESHSFSSVLPPGMPPAIASQGDSEILNHGDPAQGPFTHPIRTASGSTVYIDETGSIVIKNMGETDIIEANALPDGRILSDGDGKLLVLTDPTTDYSHGVLGDAVEAKSVTLLNENGQILNKITLSEDLVIEGIMPIWSDLNQDGEREIIITASNSTSGARLVAFSEDGTEFASSTAIGTGFRWRNQMAVAPFGPNGELELVDVLTPHLNGTVEFFQLEGGSLERVAWISGYTSHSIGSRNLDMGLAADLDADGQVEVLLPTLAYDALGIIKRTTDGAVSTANLSLGGRLTTNLAGVSLADGTVVIALGTNQGELLVWMP